MKPGLDLFLMALIVGLGFGLGYPVMCWLVGKVTSFIDRQLNDG